MEYTLRELKSEDIFPMFAIISKIGIEEIVNCFDPNEIKSLLKEEKENTGSEDNSEANDALATRIGFKVILEAVNLVMKNISKCEKDVYKFLSGLSGLSVDEIAGLRIDIFMQMIIDVFRKDEFLDFIRVVSKLFR